jgi:2-polyprenyl-6-methoxyphenol hydroxylase-like FAD-dependent oxidoreductase
VRVAIAGAGLGGLCLAQGLLRAGIDAEVYERDPSPWARRQGYRLHVDSRAGSSLERCLPPALYSQFLATTGRPSTKVTVLSSRLRVLHTTVVGGSGLNAAADRGTLREILASGLGERIHYGRPVTGFAAASDGVTVRFEDGSTHRADVLVGADGVSSAVRAARLPSATVVDTGSRVLYGRTPLTADVRGLLPPALSDGFTAVVGGSVGLAMGLVEFRTPPASLSLRPVDDYLMWAVSSRDLPSESASWPAVALRMLHGWHPDLWALIAAADVDETFLIRVRTSRRVPAWAPSRVTVLGDAIHAMSPSRGSGANTALLDAANLCEALVSAGGDVAGAIGHYEERMRDYGFAAVEASERAEARGPGGVLGRLLAAVANRPNRWSRRPD